jgi:hypothetical protein
MKQLGRFAGADVIIEYDDPPRIVLRCNPSHPAADLQAIHALGDALGGFTRLSHHPPCYEAELRYTDSLDARLVRLADLLVAIRYAHPRMVQLPLSLTDEEAHTLAEALNA